MKRIVWAGLALVLAGCAQPRAVLQIGPALDAAGQPLVWPAAPEVPRFMYMGDLTGEDNFKRSGEETRKTAGRVWDWLVGLGGGEAAQLVLQRPQSGAVDDAGRIYVTDSSRQAVMVFDDDLGELLVWDVAEPQVKFSAPAGIAIGANAEILVADAELAMVVRLSRDGTPAGQIGKGLLKRPVGLARDPLQRRIYVSDARAHDVKVFDDEGNLLKTIGRHGDGSGEFNFPTYLAFKHGLLYVTDTMNNRIQVFDAEGKVVNKFGQRGLYVGNLVRPKGVAVDDENNIYVIESYYDHLLVFSPAGDLLLALGGAGKEAGHFYLPAGVWVDRFNRVFIADMFNGRVAVFQFLGGS